MASDITLLGATYSSVPAVLLPKSGGGTVKFTDVTQTDAVESNVESGKVFFLADGSIALGTRTISLQSKNVTPSESVQSVEYDSGYDGLSKVTVAAISSTYVGTGITRRAASSLTASGSVVTVPSGYYSAQVSKAVSAGTAAGPATVTGTGATMNVGTNTVTLSKTVSITPVVPTPGYVTAGTASNATVTLSATMTTKAATTYNVSANDQTIASGQYLTGAQTIRGVTYTGLSSSYILDGITVKIGDAADDDRIALVTGNVTFQQYYTGNSAPATSLGSDGDIYLNTSGGGGGSITVEGITLTSNGVYTAPSGIAYTPVTVSVPMPSGTSVITANGIYDISAYASASVSVSGGITPTGTSVITSNGTYDVTNYASASVNVSGGEEEPDYVYFYDYEGTLLYKYTTTEFATMSSMPSNPNHGNNEVPLTSLGWNWSLADAKDFISTNGSLIIGQMYKPTDNVSHIIIEIPSNPYTYKFGFGVSSCIINWGDGTTSTSTAVNSYLTHVYEASGRYDITIMPKEGGLYPAINYIGAISNTTTGETYVMKTYIKKIYLHNIALDTELILTAAPNLTELTISDMQGQNVAGFRSCDSLKCVILPAGLEQRISFAQDYNLFIVSLPNGITWLANNGFQHTSIEMISLPKTITTMNSGLFNYSTIRKAVIPSLVTGINDFVGCAQLTSIELPSGLTLLNGFQNCTNLTSITIPSTVISIGANAFNSCDSLNAINLPSNLASIGSSAFISCKSLTSITIPSLVNTLPHSMVKNCVNLSSIKCLGTIDSIGPSAFANCSRLINLDFTMNSSCWVGESAFQTTRMTNLDLSHYSAIPAYFANNNPNISSITIGTNITQVGNSAFLSCQALGAIFLLSETPPTISNTSAFGSVSTNHALMYVPYSADHTVLAAYQTAANWSSIASYLVEMPAS